MGMYYLDAMTNRASYLASTFVVSTSGSDVFTRSSPVQATMQPL